MPAGDRLQPIDRAHRKASGGMPSELMTLPLPGGDGKGPLAGYFLAPNIGAYFSSIQWEFIEEHLSPQSEIPNLVRRDAEHEVLRPWNGKDLVRLGMAERKAAEQIEIETLKTIKMLLRGFSRKQTATLVCDAKQW